MRRSLLGVLLTPLVLAACEPRGPDHGPEWDLLRSLAAPAGLTAPDDRSNRYSADPAAQELGRRFYFDTDFSGRSTLVDMLGRPVGSPPARAAKGQPIHVSCATCHDPARGGSDHTSQAQVSMGAGAYDVSSQPSVNSAFATLWYWNGRNDSLWSQIIAVTESPVSMGSNRLHVMWRIASAYRGEFQAIFGPLPVSVTATEQRARLEDNGECTRAGDGSCPSADCVATSSTACWPRFPLEGRPGRTAGCQRGDASEPFGDAFDCMEAADRDAVTGVYVNFAKAIAAYEGRLISHDSPFDRWVAARERGEDGREHLSPAAERGARLFVGDASCAECHRGPLLTDNDFHDIGVPQDGPFVPTEAMCPAGAACDCVAGRNCLPWGLADGLSKLHTNGFRRDSKWSDDPTDTSRAAYYDVQDLAPLRGRWRTPGLRDVAITAPYMHTGRYQTLREVVQHYNAGGIDPSGRAPKVVPLGLDDTDLDDLVAFMESLTGAPLPEALLSSSDVPASSF